MPRSVRKRERRRHSRSPISKVVTILWEDYEGTKECCKAG